MHDVNEPLLPGQPSSNPSQQTTQHVQPGRLQQRQKAGSNKLQGGAHDRLAAVDLGARFLQRLWRIFCLINAAPALSLVLISLAETVIVSKIGTISGLFYQGNLVTHTHTSPANDATKAAVTGVNVDCKCC
jgi:hypothetical protein